MRGGGGVPKNQCIGGNCLIRRGGGAWTVSRFRWGDTLMPNAHYDSLFVEQAFAPAYKDWVKVGRAEGIFDIFYFLCYFKVIH